MSETSTSVEAHTYDEVRVMLLAHVEIDNQDIPEIVGRAVELQDERERAESEHSTRDEVQAIASELDLKEHHVNQAIEEYLTNRARQPQDSHALEVARTQRSAMLWLRLSIASFLFFSVLAVLPIVLALGARQAARAGDIQDARSRIRWTQMSLVALSVLVPLLVIVLYASLGLMAAVVV